MTMPSGMCACGWFVLVLANLGVLAAAQPIAATLGWGYRSEKFVQLIELAPVLSAIMIATFCSGRMIVRAAAIFGGTLTTAIVVSTHSCDGRFSWPLTSLVERHLAGGLAMLVPSSVALMWITTVVRVGGGRLGHAHEDWRTRISIRGMLVATAAIFASLAWVSHVESAWRDEKSQGSRDSSVSPPVGRAVEGPNISAIRLGVVVEVLVSAPPLVGLMLLGWWCGSSRVRLGVLSLVGVTLIAAVSGPGRDSRPAVMFAFLLTCATLIALNAAIALRLLNVHRLAMAEINVRRES